MKSKEEIKELVIDAYWGHLTKTNDAIRVGKAIIFIDQVVDYAYLRQGKYGNDD